MAWYPPQMDGARVGLVLGYGEESETSKDPIGEGCRWIDLSITAGPDHAPVDVSLSADDARFLAAQLEAYANALDHAPVWMTRAHLGMTAGEYAIEWLEGRMPHSDDRDAPAYCVCGELARECPVDPRAWRGSFTSGPSS